MAAPLVRLQRLQHVRWYVGQGGIGRCGGAAIIEGAEDESPVVALSCPACSAPLRPCDARKLLERDQALLTEFDIGLRDACLRGSADYRPCPHCKAGGFVTWRCVAMARAGPRAAARIIGGFVTFGCIRVAAGGRLAKLAALPPDESEDATLIFIAIVCLATSHGVLKVARWAAAEAPMDVSCPECDARFPLASNDAAADSASATAAGPSSHVKGHDAADAAWVREHTAMPTLPRAHLEEWWMQCNEMRTVRPTLLLGVHAILFGVHPLQVRQQCALWQRVDVGPAGCGEWRRTRQRQ